MMKKLISQRDAYGQALLDLAKEDERIIGLSPDLAGSTRIEKLASLGEGRFFNLGVSEQNAVGLAAGLAMEGFIPFLSSFAVFITGRVFDQIRVSIVQNQANVKLIGSHLGFSNPGDGASAQSIADIALMRSLPGMTILSPADANQTKAAVRAAAKHEGPVYLRISRIPTPTITNDDLEIGQSQIIHSGKKITLVATGPIMAQTLDWLDELDVELINCSTIKPLDEATIIASAQKTGRVVTLEEHSIIGGLGSAVTEALSAYQIPVKRLGIKDVFGQSARSVEQLYQHYGLDKETIKKQVIELEQ